MDAYELALWPLAAYVVTGLVFAAAFLTFGVARVDPGARGSGVAFRLLLVPGTVLVWPVLARRWVRAQSTEKPQ